MFSVEPNSWFDWNFFAFASLARLQRDFSMTQLLLFDTPTAESFAPIAPATKVPGTRVPATKAPATQPDKLATSANESNFEHQRGLNHMGDLARLVLLRYDLVAQRRAKRLARQAK